MNPFDGLLEAYGDEQADADCGNVDEEVAPGMGGVVGGMDVEHGGGFLCGRDRWAGGLWGWRDGVLLGHGLGWEECIAHPPPMR